MQVQVQSGVDCRQRRQALRDKKADSRPTGVDVGCAYRNNIPKWCKQGLASSARQTAVFDLLSGFI